MTTVGERLSKLEGSYEQMTRRLDDLVLVVQGIDRKVDDLRSDMDNKIDRLGHRVYLIGAALWATLAAGLFAIAAGFISQALSTVRPAGFSLVPCLVQQLP